jgi:mono/diheme cytochrome c family protein
MKLVLFCVTFALLARAQPATAAELTVNLGSDGRTYSTEALLRRADVQTLQVTGDVAFHRTMHYRVVPLNALLGGISKKDHLQFVARDGFAAEIPASLLLGTNGSEAWLAIEDPAHPWPALPDHHGSAGPFYVVWSNPQAAGIDPEQWPYQLASIRRLGDVESRFPAMLPDRAVPADSPIRRGFAVFEQTCLACHTINGAGDAQLGPDLNLPHNPTEYLRADLLRAYIRDPQSLRHWPQAKMPGFSRAVLPDADLDALLAYLRHMADRKVPP